jgi:hypothetical protein
MSSQLQVHSHLGRTNVIWQAVDWMGYEHLYLEEWPNGFIIDGLVIAVLEDQPSRTWYRIEVDREWEFRSLRLAHTDELDDAGDGPLDLVEQSHELVRTSGGLWDHDWIDGAPDLDGCIDIDITATPFTNTLPIRRLALQPGESAEIDVAYVGVPELSLTRTRQRYTRLDGNLYRFESLDSDFTADISVDDTGLVTDYPGLFRRVWPETAAP